MSGFRFLFDLNMILILRYSYSLSNERIKALRILMLMDLLIFLCFEVLMI